MSSIVDKDKLSVPTRMAGEENSGPRQDQHWVVRIPTEIFQQIKSDPEFCALVALARAVNALHLVLTPLLDAGFGNDPKAIRARYNSLFYMRPNVAQLVRRMAWQ